MLLLAIPTTAYAERVQVMVGSKIINKALSCMTVGELAHATVTWRQAHFGAVMSGLLQLSCSTSEKLKMENLSGESDAVEVQKYQLDGVKGAVHTTQKVTIPPFQTMTIKGNAGIKRHCMKVHVLMEPVLSPQLPAAVVPIATYGELHPGSSSVPICLCNMSTCAMEIPAKTVGWSGNPCQPGTTGGPPDQDYWSNNYKHTQRLGLGSSRPQRVAWIRAETG